MKVKIVVLFSFFLSCINYAFSQKNVKDSLKVFTISVIQQAIEKGKVKKLAVWDFTDMNKEVFNFGSYIAEQFSVYAEQVDSVELMDRQNLKSILNEHKLKSEGFIDKNTIMELGKFKDVDAVVVGSVIIADKDFQVVVKIVETSLGRTVAADEEFFPIDKKMAAILGIEYNGESSSTSNMTSPNRGFNRQLNSNEQYNNQNTVKQSCELNNTGDYCFYNSTNGDITVFVAGTEPNHTFPTIVNDFILKPKESKCIYNYAVKNSYSFKAVIPIPNNPSNPKIIDQGNFTIEKCKSKTYSIK